MSQLTVDDNVVALLASLTRETSLLDRSGKVIGRFLPEIDQAAMHAKYGHLWTEEDLTRAEEIKKEIGGQPLREVWKEIRGENTT